MFDGMPEQFYQFLAAATTTSRTTQPTNNITTTTAAALSLPLSFSLHHHHAAAAAAAFPTYSPPPQPPFDPPYHHLMHHHHNQFITRNNVKDDETTLNHPTPPPPQLPSSLQSGGETQRSSSSSSSLMLLPDIPWSNDEMLALFRIRSSMDNTWFPDFIWESVSRKLAEMGFKRSAEKCKEKFEEETRSFNTSIISNNNNNCSTKNTTPSNNNHLNNDNNNNYRLFGELEELCNNTNTNNIDSRQSLPLQSEDDNDGEENEEMLEDEGLGNAVEVEGDEDNNNNNNNNNNNVKDDDNNVEEDEQSGGDSEKTEENTKRVMKKRKRQKKFEMFKGFCEKIVSKMMTQQEELHCKILQDMVKRDEEKIAKEEAWKKQEFQRLEKELEVRAHDQVVSGDRQRKILDFLNSFTSSSSSSHCLEAHSLKQALEKLNKVSNLSQVDSISAQLQPTSSCTTQDNNNHSPMVVIQQVEIDKSKLSSSSQNPNNPLISSQDESSKLPSLVSSRNKLSRSDHTSTNAADFTTSIKSLGNNNNQGSIKPDVGKGNDDTGRRWPRDEVLALINIRCSLFSNNGGDNHNLQDKDGFNKGPLWERISHKMMELGYKRSAKRCKEKWENINKYFRKTKDMNKKRSIDSRTCPYYHQLSHLYSQGTLTGSTDRPINLPGSPENRSSTAFSGQSQGNRSSTPPPNNGATNTMHASQGNEANVVQVPGFDFDF